MQSDVALHGVTKAPWECAEHREPQRLVEPHCVGVALRDGVELYAAKALGSGPAQGVLNQRPAHSLSLSGRVDQVTGAGNVRARAAPVGVHVGGPDHGPVVRLGNDHRPGALTIHIA